MEKNIIYKICGKKKNRNKGALIMMATILLVVKHPEK